MPEPAKKQQYLPGLNSAGSLRSPEKDSRDAFYCRYICC